MRKGLERSGRSNNQKVDRLHIICYNKSDMGICSCC